MGKRYNIETMTLDDFREMIANGEDSHNNQVVVTKSGEVLLTEHAVSLEELKNLAYTFEEVDAGEGYVGIKASMDDNIVIGMHVAMKENWENGCPKRCLDFWVKPLELLRQSKFVNR